MAADDTARIDRLERAVAELVDYLRTMLAVGEQHAPNAIAIKEEIQNV
jgi:hypothetical protein